MTGKMEVTDEELSDLIRTSTREHPVRTWWAQTGAMAAVDIAGEGIWQARAVLVRRAFCAALGS